MAKTLSNMVPLGTHAPDFHLENVVNSQKLALKDISITQGLVVAFWCNHCPYVQFIQDKFIEVARTYQEQGIKFVAINSNDVDKYPDDAPDKMKSLALEKNFPFPYLFDETQEVAKSYQAACTPDFYLFDKDSKCVYRGQFDEARPGLDISPSGSHLKQAMDALIGGKEALHDQIPSMGCNIKWKA